MGFSCGIDKGLDCILLVWDLEIVLGTELGEVVFSGLGSCL